MIIINQWKNGYFAIVPYQKHSEILDRLGSDSVIKTYRGLNSLKAAWILLDRLGVEIGNRGVSSLFPTEDIAEFYKWFNKQQGKKQIELFPKQTILI